MLCTDCGEAKPYRNQHKEKLRKGAQATRPFQIWKSGSLRADFVSRIAENQENFSPEVVPDFLELLSSLFSGSPAIFTIFQFQTFSAFQFLQFSALSLMALFSYGFGFPDVDREFRRLHREMNRLWDVFDNREAGFEPMFLDAPPSAAAAAVSPSSASASTDNKMATESKEMTCQEPQADRSLKARAWFRTPAVNVHETNDAFMVDAELPGCNKEDISLTVDKNVLTLRGEKKEEQKEQKEQDGGKYLRYESRHGCFQRSLVLPDNVDAAQISASHNNGMLNIKIPKVKNPTPPVRQITIS